MPKFISNFRQIYAIHIWHVFVSTIFLVYTWSIYILLWDIPALILKYKIIDIVGYTAYQLTFALVESILITLLVIIVSFLLPNKFLRKNLSVRGSLLVISVGLGLASIRLLPVIAQSIIKYFPDIESSFVYQFIFGSWLFLVIIIVLIMIKVGKSDIGGKLTLQFLERLSTLSSLYVIIGICSFFTVIFRNIK